MKPKMTKKTIQAKSSTAVECTEENAHLFTKNDRTGVYARFGRDVLAFTRSIYDGKLVGPEIYPVRQAIKKYIETNYAAAVAVQEWLNDKQQVRKFIQNRIERVREA